MGNREMNTTDANAGIAARVRAFNLMQLPGQPMGMHMGTSYLVNDLAAEVIRLTQINAEMTAANAALMVRVEAARGLMDRFRGFGCPNCCADCSSANPPLYDCIMIAARAWLAGGAE